MRVRARVRYIPARTNSSGETVGGKSVTNRRNRDRLPTSARPASTRQSDHDGKTRREPGATRTAAAERGRRQRPRPPQQRPAATGATGARGAPAEEEEDEDSSQGLGFDSESGDLDDYSTSSWSDEGGSADDDGWSDYDGDEESDWGRGVAGGPGGRRAVRRREVRWGGVMFSCPNLGGGAGMYCFG